MDTSHCEELSTTGNWAGYKKRKTHLYQDLITCLIDLEKQEYFWAGSEDRISPDSTSTRRHWEDHFLCEIWTVWVSGNADGTMQCASNLADPNEQYILRSHWRLPGVVYGLYPDIQQEWKRPHEALEERVAEIKTTKYICLAKWVFVYEHRYGISWLCSYKYGLMVDPKRVEVI
jgi:hypothetical protein